MADTTSVFYQIGQAVSQKISNSSGFSGGTITSNITIQNDNPVLLLKDTQSDGAPSNQASYLEYLKSDGSAKGYVGYGTNGDDDLDLKNNMGHVRISPASGHQVYIDNNAVITSANISSYTPTVSSASQKIQDATGSYGSVKVTATMGTYAGYFIFDYWGFMAKNRDFCGIFNDSDNEWGVICRRNAETELFHNGVVKMETTSSGISVLGAVGVTTGEISSVGKGRFGGWGTYSTYSGAATEIGVSSGDGWILPYNRGTSSYLPNMIIKCGARIRLNRDTKGTEIQGTTTFGPADQTYQTLRISPGLAVTNSTSYISTYNSNNMGFRTGGTNLGMEITNTGAYVRTPKNPHFFGKKTVHQQWTGTVIFDYIFSQVGSNYNTATGYFTAPVSGRYICSFSCLPFNFSTSTSASAFWYKNGSLFQFAGLYTRMNGNYFGQGNTIHVYLNQGDYIYPLFNQNGTSVGLHSGYTSISISYIG